MAETIDTTSTVDRRPAWSRGGLSRNLRVSVAALILSNLWPLLGVLFFGWNVFMIMFVFWFENVIIGFYNVLRMLTARGGGAAGCASGLFFIPFFTVHYGLFCFVHGAFVFGMFGGGNRMDSPFDIMARGFPDGTAGAALMLFLSHGVSFIMNYIVTGEYKNATPHMLMGKPYARIVVLHLAILFGGMLAMATGSSRPAVVILVLLKIGIDVAAHVAEHKGVPMLKRLAAKKLSEAAQARLKQHRGSEPLD